MAEKQVAVKLTARIEQYQKSMRDAKRSTTDLAAGTTATTKKMGQEFGYLGGSVGGAVKTMAAFGVGGLAYKALGSSINEAQNLQESTNAVRVAFGDAADSVLAIGENSATSFGLAKSEFNELAVRFSGFASTIASGTGQQVSEVVEDMTLRVADFASVMNIDVPEAAAVMMSTLSGETEPIRRYGIDVSAAAVETFLLAEGLVESKGAITEADKQLGRYLLTMQETEKVAGDFAATSGEAANANRILQARLKDVAATAGSEMLPTIAAVTTALVDFLTVAEKAGALNLADALTLGTMPSKQQRSGLVPEHNEGSNFLGRISFGLLGDAGKEAAAADELAASYNGLAAASSKARLEGRLGASARGAFDAAEAMSEYQRELDKAARTGILSGEALARRNERLEESAEAAREAAEAEREFNEAIQAGAASIFNYEDSLLGLASAYSDYEVQLMETSELQKDSETSDREKEQALRDLRQAEIDLAGSALATAQAYAEEQGAVSGSRQEASLMIGELLRQREEYPALRDEIDVYIGKLSEIPGSVPTDVQALIDQGKYAEAEAALDRLARPRNVSFSVSGPGGTFRYAGGTDYHPGGMAVVGEDGPELVDLPRGSRVHTAAETRGMLTSPYAAAMSAGGSSSVVNIGDIHIHAAPGMNEEALARATINRIRRFERSNGPGWRAA